MSRCLECNYEGCKPRSNCVCHCHGGQVGYVAPVKTSFEEDLEERMKDPEFTEAFYTRLGAIYGPPLPPSKDVEISLEILRLWDYYQAAVKLANAVISLHADDPTLHLECLDGEVLSFQEAKKVAGL